MMEYKVKQIIGEDVTEMIVDDEWMEGIPRKGIISMELTKDNQGEILEVRYVNKKTIIYRNVFGHWDNGTRIR